MEGARMPGTAPTQIGTAVHESTAAYDQNILDGKDGDVSGTVEIAVDLLEHPNEEVDWQGVRLDTAIEAAVNAHVNYCNWIAPEFNYVAVEHTLESLQVDMGDGIIFELTGTLDRIYENNLGQKGILDVKTGKAIVDAHGDVKTAKHKSQLGEYELLGEKAFGALDAPAVIAGLGTTGAYRHGTAQVHNAKEALIGTEYAPGLLQYAASMFKTGMFPPNPSSFLCSKTYCPIYHRCQFHG
jgi:hypothetical protein